MKQYTIKEIFEKSEENIENNISNGVLYNTVGLNCFDKMKNLEHKCKKSMSIDVSYYKRHILTDDCGEVLVDEIENESLTYSGYYLTILLAIKYASLSVNKDCPVVELDLTVPNYINSIKEFNGTLIRDEKCFLYYPRLSDELISEAVKHNVYVHYVNCSDNNYAEDINRERHKGVSLGDLMWEEQFRRGPDDQNWW